MAHYEVTVHYTEGRVGRQLVREVEALTLRQAVDAAIAEEFHDRRRWHDLLAAEEVCACEFEVAGQRYECKLAVVSAQEGEE